MLVLGMTASLLGVNRYLTANGLNLGALLGFAALMGFGGAFISLWLSKPIAKWSTGARVIGQPSNATEAWLMNTSPPGPARRHRDAGSGRVRRRAERLRHRRDQERLAGGGVDRPAAIDDA
jgi:Zn-dependent protease with chaperone function